MEQAQHNPYPLDDVQHFFFKRSLSQQDILGRTNNNFPQGPLGLQADLQTINPTSGVTSTIKTLTEDSTTATTARMPFPPIPKVEQLPLTMPPLPPSSVQQVSSYPTTGSQVLEMLSLDPVKII